MQHPFEDLATTSESMDARGVPTQSCPMCGCEQFYLVAWFNQDTYALAGYLTDAKCAACGSLVTACTEIDHPDYTKEQ